jgi:hypothetical protein
MGCTASGERQLRNRLRGRLREARGSSNTSITGGISRENKSKVCRITCVLSTHLHTYRMQLDPNVEFFWSLSSHVY